MDDTLAVRRVQSPSHPRGVCGARQLKLGVSSRHLNLGLTSWTWPTPYGLDVGYVRGGYKRAGLVRCMRNDTLIVMATQRRDRGLFERGLKPHDRIRKLFKRILFVLSKRTTPIVMNVLCLYGSLNGSRYYGLLSTYYVCTTRTRETTLPEILTILEGGPLQVSSALVAAPGLQTEYGTSNCT